MGPISHDTLLIQASFKGWSVLVNGEPLMSSWSRTLAEEALNIRRSGKAVEILVKGLFGPARMIAQAVWAAAVEKALP